MKGSRAKSISSFLLRKHTWTVLAFLGWGMFVLRSYVYIDRVLPDRDEGHYTIIGYLWTRDLRDPDILSLVHQRWQGEPVYNAYYMDPSSHFPVAYLIHGWTQHWWGPGWWVGRVVGWFFSALGMLGLMLLAARLFGWIWATGLIWLVTFTHFFAVYYNRAVAQPIGFAFLVWGFLFAFPRTVRWQHGLSGLMLALFMHTRAESWAILPFYLGFLYFSYRQGHRRYVLSNLFAWVATSALLYIATWPIILYVWGQYVNIFVPLREGPASQFRPVPYTWASRWLAWSLITRQEPLLFWGMVWLLTTRWWQLPFEPERAQFLRWLYGSLIALWGIMIYILVKSAAPYNTYQTLFSPLFFLVLPSIFYVTRPVSKGIWWIWISAFLLWSWQVGYSLHPVLFVRGQTIFRKGFLPFLQQWFPPSWLIPYDFPPYRVYEGITVLLMMGLALVLWFMITAWLQERFKALEGRTLWVKVLLPILFFIPSPLSATVEDLPSPPFSVFDLHNQRVQTILEWRYRTFDHPPTLINQGEPVLLIDLVDQFEWRSFKIHNAFPEVWVVPSNQFQALPPDYVPALTVPKIEPRPDPENEDSLQMVFWIRKSSRSP